MVMAPHIQWLDVGGQSVVCNGDSVIEDPSKENCFNCRVYVGWLHRSTSNTTQKHAWIFVVVGKTPETLWTHVKLSGKQLEQVKQFKYLGCDMPDAGRSTNKVKIRAAMAMSSLIKMDKFWKSKKISFVVKLRLLRSIVNLRMRILDIQWRDFKED